MKTLKQLRGILETPVEQDDSILVGKFPKQPLEEDVEKSLTEVIIELKKNFKS